MNAKDALLLVEGFLEGAVKAEGLDTLGQCIQDVETIVPTATKTFNDCKTASLDGKLQCVKDFAELTKEAKATIADCKHLKNDIKVLEHIVKIFSNPVSFVWHVGKDLIVNGIQIFHDVESAVDAWNQQQWRSFGYNVGHATSLVILGAESQAVFADEPVDPEDFVIAPFPIGQDQMTLDKLMAELEED